MRARGDGPERKEPVTIAAACTPPMEGVDNWVIVGDGGSLRLDVGFGVGVSFREGITCV